MKAYSIGRDESCNIVISDSTNLVSRHHATLNVDGSNMNIIDESSNGTFINGIKIASGTPVPVTRKDVISFAQVANLDWKLIPNHGRKIFFGILIAIVVLAIAGGVAYYYWGQIQQQKESEEIRHAEALKNDSIRWTNVGNEIHDIEQKINQLSKRFEAEGDSAAKIEKIVAQKVSGKETNEVIEIIGQIKAEIKTVDFNSVAQTLVRVKDNFNDHSAETGDRFSSLKKTVTSYEMSVNKISRLLIDANHRLEKIKNKAATPKPVQKPEEKKEEGIQSPRIF